MKITLATATLTLLAAPALSLGALSFDVDSPPYSGFDGVNTTQSDFVQVGDPDFVPGLDFNGGAGNLTFGGDPTGNGFQFAYDGTSGASNSEYYADLQVTNSGARPINEFDLFFTLSRINGDGFTFMTVLWSPDTGGAATFTEVGNISPGDTTFHFQGEDVWTFSNQAVLPPLLVSGDTGTLRFAFSGTGGNGSPGSEILNFNLGHVLATVPEPSSALLLSGILGLFGGFFRKRRTLAQA